MKSAREFWLRHNRLALPEAVATEPIEKGHEGNVVTHVIEYAAFEDLLTEAERLAGVLAKCEWPLQRMRDKGHHDTCSAALSSDYSCDCGLDRARPAVMAIHEALAKWRAFKGEL